MVRTCVPVAHSLLCAACGHHAPESCVLHLGACDSQARVLQLCRILKVLLKGRTGQYTEIQLIFASLRSHFVNDFEPLCGSSSLTLTSDSFHTSIYVLFIFIISLALFLTYLLLATLCGLSLFLFVQGHRSSATAALFGAFQGFLSFHPSFLQT